MVRPLRDPGRQRRIGTAFLIYVTVALYLFLPYLLPNMRLNRIPVALWPIVAAMGIYILSRRWIGAFFGSLFAGLVYGFGPFVLHFTTYHPLAGLVPALLPWLFCPAIFYRVYHRKTVMTRIIPIVLATLPFAFVLAFYWACRVMHVFPTPLEERLSLQSLTGFLVPYTCEPVGVYHVPVATLIVGAIMHAIVHRFSTLAVVLAGLILAFSKPILQATPLVWTAIPMIYCCILVGIGSQGLAWSGRADRKWIFLCVIVALMLAATTALLGMRHNPQELYRQATLFYLLAMVMSGLILLVSRSAARWHGLRWLLLASAMGVDILFSARYILDKLLIT
ncbi:MAG: hypothetical protein JXA82_05280 [Sedimentisphaerales bacterium]|nr:hypothetical protein [Sedimentisphaerales bacterium]